MEHTAERGLIEHTDTLNKARRGRSKVIRTLDIGAATKLGIHTI